MEYFVATFNATWMVLQCVAGVVAALALLLLAVAAIAFVGSAVFSLLTGLMAARWQRRGHIPRNRVEKIIMDSEKRGDS